MGFVLRIYLFGLLALAPSEDGRELTVLLLDARHGAIAARGHEVGPHQPMVLARAGGCTGECWLESDAQSILAVAGEAEARRAELRRSVGSGAVWLLHREELSIGGAEGAGGVKIALTDDDGGWWVPNLSELAPEAGGIAEKYLAAGDPGTPVLSRLRLRSGKVEPYRFVVYDGEIVSLAFQAAGEEARPVEPRPYADWLVAEIPIKGCEVTLTGSSFDGRSERRMTLSPEACDGSRTVEVALLNVSEEGGPLPIRSKARSASDPVGHHFAMYYELAANPPAVRPLPVVAPSQRRYRLPAHATDSLLLAGLRMSDWRGSYSLPICPPAFFGPGS